MKKIFVVGISTDVGKTILSAIISESISADYWKPLQSGNLNQLDSKIVESLWTNKKSQRIPEKYLLTSPISPDQAAKIDNIKIDIKQLIPPTIKNDYLIIEGVGGLLVPINSINTISDLISDEDYIILVSKNYLGSINHTLLSLEYLKSKKLSKIGIIFNGEDNPETEKSILNFSNVKVIGRIPILQEINKKTIKYHAESINKELINFLER